MQGFDKLLLMHWLAALATTLGIFTIAGASGAAAQSRAAPARFQQIVPLAALPAREVSDQDHARSRMRSGENRSFEELLAAARRVGRGDFIAVEPDIATNIYRFKFMRPSGNMVWVDVDGRTARVVAERE